MATNKEYRARLKEIVDEWKKQGCTFCGEYHPAIMEAHHVSEKDYDINKIHKNVGEEKLREELAKCVPVCANCHRKHHWVERRT